MLLKILLWSVKLLNSELDHHFALTNDYNYNEYPI
jgi:hypothetical protein